MDRRDLLEISPYQADEGELIGKHPSDVPSDSLCRKFRAQNPLKAIREKCLDCCCGNAAEVRKCSYPKYAPQPLKEEYLLSGPLEPTNEWHALAKIAGVKMCQAYRQQHGLDAIVAMSTNVYGPGDNFDPASSHLLPALMRRFHEAKRDALPSLTLWGTGTPRREFIHSDDLARACVFLMQKYSNVEMVNVGWGEDHAILHLANIVKEVVGYDVPIVLDTSKPDGTPRKLLDVSTMNALGFRPRIGLREGLASMYAWYLAN